MKQNSSAARNEWLLNAPIEQVIPKLAIPTIISMLITSIYNMADTFFVSQLGTSASGAVGIVFSAMTMIQAISFMIGMGAGNNISRLLGAGEQDEAGRYASTAWFTGFATGCVIAVIGLTHTTDIVMLLGSTDTIAPYAAAYAKYIFLATPFMVCSLIMNNILRYQGLAVYSMVGIAIGGVLNIILDPILIFCFGFGTAGAGMATGLSQLISFFILIFMCNSRKDTLSIRLRNFSPTKETYGKILYTGAPSLARQGITSVSTVVLNSIAGQYGDAAIAALSIVSRYTMFINSAIIGFGQGFQPVCGFNFGAKKYDRVKRSFWFCVRVATIALILLCAVSLIFSGHIIALFRKDDAAVIAIGTFALRAQLMTMPLWGFYVFSNMISQTIGYGFRASVISCARQGLFLLPVLCVLPRLFGITGLQLSQPLSDILAFLLSVVLVCGILKEISRPEIS